MGYKLDECQRNVVLSESKYSLVLAGAGSGKSLTIIAKIVYLIECLHINKEDILVISLTNDAVNSLKSKLSTYYSLDIPIYTFHKLALLIIGEQNLEYQIADENMLREVTDLFFNNAIINNKLYKKAYYYLVRDSNDLLLLKKTIITFIHLFKSNNRDIIYFKEILKSIKYNLFSYRKNKYLLLFIINVYLLYCNELKNGEYIDFDDMINLAINNLKNNGTKYKWKYIIIDEYQDSSIIKVNLIKEIIRSTNAKLLAVGDDYQSIYRFTGSDLEVFVNFKDYFCDAKIYKLINTYRNSQELLDISLKFIMKNKRQIKKMLISKKSIDYPVKIYYARNVKRCLKDLLILNKNYKEIMVLGRNNKDIFNYIDDDYKKLDNSIYVYNSILFKYMTIHKSKGLESDVVILINVSNNIIGIPSKLKDEKILKYVKNSRDYYPYEEERRLFYVALTRTKNYVYIISEYNNESIFTKELKKYKNVDIIKE